LLLHDARVVPVIEFVLPRQQLQPLTRVGCSELLIELLSSFIHRPRQFVEFVIR